MKRTKIINLLSAVIMSLMIICGTGADVRAEGTWPIILQYEEPNEYSEILTYNAGLDDEYSFIAYFLPEGTYSAKNLSGKAAAFFLRSRRTVFKDGREAPAEDPVVIALAKDEATEFEVERDQYFYLFGYGAFEITPIDPNYLLSSTGKTYDFDDNESPDEAPVKAAADIYLDDRMGYYGDRTDEVRRMLEEVSAHTGWSIGVVTCDYDYDPGQYGSSAATTMAGTKAEEIYDSTFGRDADGVLYLCDIGTRYIVVANGARKYIVGSRFDDLLSTVNSKYMNYDDFGSVKAFADGVKNCYDGGEISQNDLISQGYDTFDENGYYHVDGKSKPGTDDFLVAYGVGLIVAIIAAAGVAFHYRIPKAPSANTYLDRNTLDIYKRSNRLVRTHNYSYSNSSSSGGGGHSGGGGGFSGGHHGGGGMGGHR